MARSGFVGMQSPAKLLAIWLLPCFLVACSAKAPRLLPAPQWTGVKGLFEVGYRAHRGEKGVPDPANNPGSMLDAATWSTPDGALWMFGGANELWKYDPNSGHWTWIHSTAGPRRLSVSGQSSEHDPKDAGPIFAAGCIAWQTSDGMLWLFGSNTHQPYGDLWKFDPDLLEWTLICSGSIDQEDGTPSDHIPLPLNRRNAAVWSDLAGNLWLYGGRSLDAGGFSCLDDLWVFNINKNSWEQCLSNPILPSANAMSETGDGNASSTPGSRSEALFWQTQDGLFWLYGGRQNPPENRALLTDLWCFNPEVRTWTNIHASNPYAAEDLTLGWRFVEIGVSDPHNNPGGRYIEETTAFVAPDGCLWLFGSDRRQSGIVPVFWKFDPASRMWTIVNEGKTSLYVPHKGGTFSDNEPLPRQHFSSWYSTEGRLYIFGGAASAHLGLLTSALDDFWRYDLRNNSWELLGGSDLKKALTVRSNPGISHPKNVPGGRHKSAAWTDTKGLLWLFGGYGSLREHALISSNDLWRFDPATGNWVLINDGKKAAVQKAVEKGVADTAYIPSSATGSMTWISMDGSFWLFGGNGGNDLWKFDTISERWTLVSGNNLNGIESPYLYGAKGIFHPDNLPPALSDAACWSGLDGKLWFFGGSLTINGSPASSADLWVFDPSISQWAWMGGPGYPIIQSPTGPIKDESATYPNARFSACAWATDDGLFWLFGGQGAGGFGGVRNDLWKYDPFLDEWTFVSGSRIPNQDGRFGDLYLPGRAVWPGARRNAACWKSKDGSLWLFGGWGYDSASNIARPLNDLWRFDPTDETWAWMGGSQKNNQPGILMQPGKPHPGNIPGARYSTATWVTPDGGLWLFGGKAMSVDGYETLLNDLWRIDVRSRIGIRHWFR